jgi:cullin-associated NEDD8-dissociated protein 1
VLSILSILIGRFPGHLTGVTQLQPPLEVLAPLLSHPRQVVRKRAIVTISQFIPVSQPTLWTKLLHQNILPSFSPGASVDMQRTTVQLVASVARQSPSQISPVLDQLVPGILKAIQTDDNELRENGLQVFYRLSSRFQESFRLQALEAIVLRCPAEVVPFLSPIIQAGNQFIKYDPVRFWQPVITEIRSPR